MVILGDLERKFNHSNRIIPWNWIWSQNRLIQKALHCWSCLILVNWLTIWVFIRMEYADENNAVAQYFMIMIELTLYWTAFSMLYSLIRTSYSIKLPIWSLVLLTKSRGKYLIRNVVISSLDALEVVILTISSAANDETSINIKTFSSQCNQRFVYNQERLTKSCLWVS